MLQIVIPMAGRGSRFESAGFKEPKPLIPVFGEPMISFVIKNLTPTISHRFIFVVQREHLDRYGLAEVLRGVAPGAVIVPIDSITEGAACTVLLAEKMVDRESPLVVANCDQYIAKPIDSFFESCAAPSLDGNIMTMRANDAKWSFVEMNNQGLVSRVVEKVVVSDQATVGVYYFSRAGTFCDSAHRMIKKNLRVNNEFYVAPVYNELISVGGKVGTFSVGDLGKGMFGLGTPSDLQFFFQNHPHLHHESFRHQINI